MENLLAVLPSVLALGAFAAVMKLILNSDRLERKAEAELYAQAGGVTALFVGVLVMLAMGLAIAVFREMVL